MTSPYIHTWCNTTYFMYVRKLAEYKFFFSVKNNSLKIHLCYILILSRKVHYFADVVMYFNGLSH